MAKRKLPPAIVSGRKGRGVMGYALFRKSTSTVEKRRQPNPGRAPEDDGTQLPPTGLDPDLAWLIEVDADQPAYDANTQRLERRESVELTLDEFGFGRLRSTWTAVDLPIREIRQKEDQADLELSRNEVRRIAKKLRNRETATLSELAEGVRALMMLSGLELDDE